MRKVSAGWAIHKNAPSLTDGDPSGIKQIVNGVMQTDNLPVYNLNGQRVNHAVKGIYIKDGRKYIMK